MPFNGKYERISFKNLDEFLTVMGINDEVKKIALNSTPIIEIHGENGYWTIVMTNKNQDTKKATATGKEFQHSSDGQDKSVICTGIRWTFELGKEFQQASYDGRDQLIIVTLEGNKLISVQRPKEGDMKTTKVTRVIQGDELVITMEIVGTDTTCSQLFKKDKEK